MFMPVSNPEVPIEETADPGQDDGFWPGSYPTFEPIRVQRKQAKCRGQGDYQEAIEPHHPFSGALYAELCISPWTTSTPYQPVTPSNMSVHGNSGFSYLGCCYTARPLLTGSPNQCSLLGSRSSLQEIGRGSSQPAAIQTSELHPRHQQQFTTPPPNKDPAVPPS